MVAEVLSNHLTASITSVVESALTNTEDYDRLELSGLLNNLNLSSRSGLVLASSQLSLEVSDSAVASSNLTILSAVVSTELVNLSIQLVDLVLVAELSLSVVVSTVAVTELVVQTSAELEQTIAAIILEVVTSNSIISTIALTTKYYSRLEEELNSLGRTKIECEINSSFRGDTVSLRSHTKLMQPS